MMSQCDFCKNDSTRFYDGRHLCEVHYALVGRCGDIEEPTEVPRCQWCGTPGLSQDGKRPRLVEHHTSYEHEKTIMLCDSCHQMVHNDPTHPLHPIDERPP